MKEREDWLIPIRRVLGQLVQGAEVIFTVQDYRQARPEKFSAVVPLMDGDEFLGSLCLIDSSKRNHADASERLLQDLARWAAAEVKLRRVAAAHAQCRQESRSDALTGVVNRAGITELLEREMSHARRTAQPVSVMMADLDHFKRVNDTHGHGVGDSVLRHVAAQIQAALRRYDVVGRYGGEEFLIVAPDADETAAGDVAERVRQKVAHSPAVMDSGRIPITISIGVAVAQPEDADTARLIERADEALYRAKEHGRNRVEIAVTAK